MSAFLLHALGLALVGLSLFLRPRLRLRTLFLLWCLGIPLLQLVPRVLIPALAGSTETPDTIITLLEWVGALLVLRAQIGLSLWGRPLTRMRIIWTALFALAIVLGGITPRASAGFAPLWLPWLLSYRWSQGMHARRIALVNLGGILSIVLCSLLRAPNAPLPEGALSGLTALPTQARFFAAIYAFIALPVTLNRVHLSIRRIWVRLVGSHLLAGLIPVTLMALFLLLAGTLFLSNYRSSLGARLLAAASRQASVELARRIADDGTVPAHPFGADVPSQTVLVREGQGPARVTGRPLAFSADSLLAQDESSERVPLLWDGTTLFLRARVDSRRGALPLRVEALAVVDSLWMVRISGLVGVPVALNPHLTVERQQDGLRVDVNADSVGEAEATRVIGPTSTRKLGLPGGDTILCLQASDKRWTSRTVMVSSSASLGEEILTLLSSARVSSTATIALVALMVIAALFLVVVWVTVTKVFEMARSITYSVRALTGATAALRVGKLDHRIVIEGQDELWGVAASFNEMAEDLEQMRERELETQRLEEELRLAREIQNRLLPAGPPTLPNFEVAGLSIPAREVGGDYFDYIAVSEGRMGLAIADVSGKGTPAALLMSAFRASLRSQDLGRLGPAEVLARVNRFIHSSVDPGRFVTAFVGLLDPIRAELRYASAGHDAPFLAKRDGTLEQLDSSGLILGMLPNATYPEASVQLEPDSLLAVFTDGVTEAQDPQGEFFGGEGISGILQKSIGQPCDQILACLVREIQSFCGPGPQSDDITVMLVRRLPEA